MFLRLLAALAALFLVSCGSAKLTSPSLSPYRMEIQQGNFVSPEMVSQLKLGMTKDQVRFVLGTPLITDSFHADRWDYVFRRQKSNSKELEHHRLAVFFEDEKLARIDSDVMPDADADAAGVKTPEAKPLAPAVRSEAPAAKAETPAVKPEAPRQPAAPAAVGAPKPVPAATPPAPAAMVPDLPGDKPQEKKGWWDKIKDAVKF